MVPPVRASFRGAGALRPKPGPDDQVALEVSGNAWEVARFIRPHVARVVVASPTDTGIRGARAKTDRLDARALAKLLAAGTLDSVWVPDQPTRAMRRRLGRRSQLVRVKTKSQERDPRGADAKADPEAADLQISSGSRAAAGWPRPSFPPRSWRPSTAAFASSTSASQRSRR